MCVCVFCREKKVFPYFFLHYECFACLFGIMFVRSYTICVEITSLTPPKQLCKAQKKNNFNDNVSQAEFYPIQINLFSFACSVTASAVNDCMTLRLNLLLKKIFPGILVSFELIHVFGVYFFFSFYWHITQCWISDFSEFTNPQEFFMDILEYWIDIVPIRWKWLKLGWIKIGCIGCNIADLHLVFGFNLSKCNIHISISGSRPGH